MAHGTGDESHLKKGLRQRHLAMIAIGGVIGAGLFVGSGAIIGEVGPAAFLTYALTGRSQIILSLLAWGVVLIAFAITRKAIGDAHLTEPGIAAEKRADVWMHERAAAAELEVDAVVGEGPLDPELIRRVREEGYSNEGV